MLYAPFLRSPHAHARIRRLDVSAALALPGVAAVLTGEDLARSSKPVRAASKTPNVKTTSYPPLALGKVRHVGEAVAMVAAASRYLAEDAVEPIVVGYEPLPAVHNVDWALEAAGRGVRERPLALLPPHTRVHGQPGLRRRVRDGERRAPAALVGPVPRPRPRH